MPGGRGGRRKGNPATAYANRSDLNGPAPVTSAPGQPYGARTAQENAQKAVPMGTPDVASAAPTARPDGMPAAGSFPDLFGPSEDPNEHVMSGAAMGPGPGPEAFGMGPEQQMQRDMDWVRPYMPAMEAAASTPQARTVVRALKAQLSYGGN